MTSQQPSQPLPAPATALALADDLRQILRAIDRRRRLLRVLQGLAETLSVAGGGFLLLAAIDALGHPGETVRETMGWVWYLVVLGVLGVRALGPALRRSSLVESARLAERAAGCQDEVIATAVQFATSHPEHVSAWMVTRTMVIAAQQLARVPAPLVVRATSAYRAAAVSLGVALVLVLACLPHGGGSFLARAALPASRITRPSATTLHVQPGDTQAAIGDTVEIAASTSGAVVGGPCVLTIHWNDAPEESMEMVPAGSGFVRQLEAVTRGFSYHVSCGDAESPRYRVRLSTPPQVEHVQLRIVPPAYSHLPVRQIDGGDARVFAGSRVTILGDLGGDAVSSASVISDAGEHAAMVLRGPPAHLTCQLQATTDVSWRWRLVAANGSVANSPQLWLLNVIADAPPTVTLSAPAVAAGIISPDQVVETSIEAHDDLAVHACELQITAHGQLIRRPLDLSGEPAQALLTVPVALAQLGLVAGDAITIQALATDSGGQTTASTPLQWTVVTPEQAASAVLASRLHQAVNGLDQAAEVCSEQARSWSALCRAAAGDDPQSRRGELVKIRDQAMASADRLGAIASDLMGARSADDGSTRLAQALGTWAAAEGEQAVTCVAHAMSDRDRLPSGMAISAAAIADLDAFRHATRVLAASADASVLQARLEASLVQWQRWSGLHAGSWEPSPWCSGLLSRFYAGIDLAGPVSYQEVGLPLIDNRVLPVLGATTYSARFSGEVMLPFAGDWHLQATADDGVRLWIDNVQLLPAKAWSIQAATTYAGHIQTSSGWHPITVEYYQAGGLATLHLECALDGEPMLPLSAERLRCHGLSPAAAGAAGLETDEQRMGRSLQQRALLEQVVATPAALHEIGEQAASSVVADLGRNAQGLLTGIDPAQLGMPPGTWLDQARQLSAVLTTATGILATSAQAVSAQYAPLTELPELHEALLRMRSAFAHLQMPLTLVDSDSLQGAWQVLAESRSWGEQLARELPRERAQLLDRAGHPSIDPRACRCLSSASRQLGILGRELTDLLPLIDRSQDPHSDHQAVQVRFGDLERHWQLAEALTRRAAQAQLAASYAQALALVEAWNSQRAEVPAAGDAILQQRLRTQLLHILATVPSEGALEALQSQLAPGDEVDPALLQAAASALQGHVLPPLTPDGELLPVITAGLEAAVQRFAAVSAQAVSGGGESVARDTAQLEAREAALAIEPESWLLQGPNPALAQAWGALGHDLERFANDGHQASELSSLAARARILMQAQTVPDSTSHSPPSAFLAGLMHLVGELVAAGSDPGARRQSRMALASLASASGQNGVSAQVRQELESADRELHDSINEERAARERFGQMQRLSASHALELEHALERAAHELAGDAREPLAAVRLALQGTAPRARDLSRRAGADQLGALSSDASDEGLRVQSAIAAPLHEAFLAAQDGRTAHLLSALGIAASSLATDEIEAAAMLTASGNRRLAQRQRLAEAVQATLPPLLPDTSPAALTAASAASHASLSAAGALGGTTSLWQSAATSAVPDPAALTAARASQLLTLGAVATSNAQLDAALPVSGGSAPVVAGMSAAVIASAAAGAEGASSRLALASAGLSPLDARQARDAARSASMIGERCEAVLDQVLATLAAGPETQDSSAGNGAVVAAARAALAIVSSQSERPQAYAQAAALIGQAASAEAMSASRSPGRRAAGDTSEDSAPLGAAMHRPPLMGSGTDGDQVWIRLSQDPRQQARSAGIERFDPEEQTAIRAYLRRLGDER